MINKNFILSKTNNILYNHLFSSYVLYKTFKNSNFKYLNSPIILLSFDCDDALDMKYLLQILEVLNKNNIKGNFAIPASYIKSNINILKELINEKHEFINHTYNHPDNFVDLDIEREKIEITRADREIKSQLNYIPKGFRAPHFSWFYYHPDKLLELYNFLHSFGYYYSSSTVLSWYLFQKWNDIDNLIKNTSFKEFPLLPHSTRSLEVFDSFHYFKHFRNKNILIPKFISLLFLKDLDKLIKYALSHQIIVNIYLDPQDLILNNLLNNVINILKQFNPSFVRYSDLL